MPFEEDSPAEFNMQSLWTRPQRLGGLGTWSVVPKYREQNRADPLVLSQDALHKAWWQTEEKKTVSWPLLILRLAGIP